MRYEKILPLLALTALAISSLVILRSARDVNAAGAAASDMLSATPLKYDRLDASIS
jgi:hypothetical protein